jgi:hypothetical protein
LFWPSPLLFGPLNFIKQPAQSTSSVDHLFLLCSFSLFPNHFLLRRNLLNSFGLPLVPYYRQYLAPAAMMTCPDANANHNLNRSTALQPPTMMSNGGKPVMAIDGAKGFGLAHLVG